MGPRRDSTWPLRCRCSCSCCDRRDGLARRVFVSEGSRPSAGRWLYMSGSSISMWWSSQPPPLLLSRTVLLAPPLCFFPSLRCVPSTRSCSFPSATCESAPAPDPPPDPPPASRSSASLLCLAPRESTNLNALYDLQETVCPSILCARAGGSCVTTACSVPPLVVAYLGCVAVADPERWPPVLLSSLPTSLSAAPSILRTCSSRSP
mmetsp:Transcript_20395/g.45408  ORF Transcript_20395/g.45408 Transcript_20395/m.45408 type:complete len:206 (-) Transcript_20395:2553-3170(-)